MTNNDKLIPKGFDGEILYICPACKEEYWLSKLEASTPGYLIPCICEKVWEIKPVRKIVFRCGGNSKPVKEKPSKCEEVARSILKKYGYTAGEIGIMVSKVNRSEIDDPKEFVEKCLASYVQT